MHALVLIGTGGDRSGLEYTRQTVGTRSECPRIGTITSFTVSVFDVSVRFINSASERMYNDDDVIQHESAEESRHH